MTLSKQPHYAQVHCVPDDYKFTADELQCIINGDMFTPRQGAIMARELLERRERDKQEPVAMHWRWINGDEGPGVWWYHEARHFEVLNQSEDRECEFVYAAPPEPLVPEMARDGQEPVVDGLIKFRKKPVVIEAVCWTGLNLHEVITFTDGPPQVRSHHAGMMWDNYSDLVRREGLKIYTLEGVMSASIGDWIIKGVNGEFYPCKPDIFAATYEKADAPVAQPVEVPEELLSIAERLVDRYIANKGTQSEFIACLTPERSTVGTGGVWDDWKALDAALKGWRADALNQTHVKQPASNGGQS